MTFKNGKQHYYVNNYSCYVNVGLLFGDLMNFSKVVKFKIANLNLPFSNLSQTLFTQLQEADVLIDTKQEAISYPTI